MADDFELSVLGEDPASELRQLLARCPDIARRRYADGDFLVREGAEDRDLYIVVKGAFTVERPAAVPGGRPVILASALCDPDSVAIVGEMAYFGTARRTASVRCSGATYVLRLEPRHIDVILGGFPMLTQVICRQFTVRLKETNDALQALQRLFALAPEKRMAAPGELLFRAGDLPGSIQQLLVGRVRLEGAEGARSVGPEDLVLGFLEPEAFLGRRPHRLTATVEQDAFLAAVPETQKETLLRCHPQLALRVLEG